MSDNKYEVIEAGPITNHYDGDQLDLFKKIGGEAELVLSHRKYITQQLDAIEKASLQIKNHRKEIEATEALITERIKAIDGYMEKAFLYMSYPLPLTLPNIEDLSRIDRMI